MMITILGPMVITMILGPMVITMLGPMVITMILGPMVITMLDHDDNNSSIPLW